MRMDVFDPIICGKAVCAHFSNGRERKRVHAYE